MPYGGKFNRKAFFDKVKRAARKANEFAKKTQFISKGLGMIDHPIAQTIADKAASLGYGYIGYGRRRRRRGRFPKGSAEAKAYMAYLRSLRRRRR